MSTKSLSVIVAAALGVAVLGAGAFQSAEEKLAFGKQEYLEKCAVCHGESGVGAGESTEALTRTPADLVTYARRNGGIYRKDLARIAIDGRTLPDSVQFHREMPVWGQEYRNEALANPAYRAPEQYVSERIDALVEYVATLQVE